MKSVMKKLFAAGMVFAMTASMLCGCTKHVDKKNYSTTIVAEYNGVEVTLAEANFMAVMSQYSYEQMYTAYFGQTINWKAEASEGATMESSVKTDVMKSLLQTTLLCSKAEEYGVTLTEADQKKVEEQVEYFLESAGAKLITRSGANEELLTKIYTNNALANRVWEYMTKDIDTTADPQDFRQIKVSYVLMVEPKNDKEDTTSTEDTDAKKEDLKPLNEAIEEVLAKAKEGKSFEDLAKEYKDLGYSVTSNTVTMGETDYADTIGPDCFKMEEGEYKTAHYESTGYYALHIDSTFDEEATDAAIEKELDNRRTKMFDEKYKKLVEEVGEYKVENEIWDNVTFDEPVYTRSTTTNSTEPATTEATEAETGSEEVNTTEE